MTFSPRPPGFPPLDPQGAAVGRTVREGFGRSAAFQACEVAVGRVGMGLTFQRQTAAATLEGAYFPTKGTRYLLCRAVVAPEAAAGFAAQSQYLTLTLTVRDSSGHTIPANDTRMPFRVFNGQPLYAQAIQLLGHRWDGAATFEAIIDIGSLIVGTPALVATDPWRFNLVVTYSGSGIALEGFTIEEIPRAMVSLATDGLPQPDPFQARQPIVDTSQTEALFSAMEDGVARGQSILTLSWDQATLAACPSTTSGSAAGLTHLVEYGGSTPVKWYNRVRRIGAAGVNDPIAFWCIYEMSTAAATGVLSIITSVGTYTLNLAYSGTFAISGIGTGFQSTSNTDTEDYIQVEASVSAGTIYLAHLGVRTNDAY